MKNAPSHRVRKTALGALAHDVSLDYPATEVQNLLNHLTDIGYNGDRTIDQEEKIPMGSLTARQNVSLSLAAVIACVALIPSSPW